MSDPSWEHRARDVARRLTRHGLAMKVTTQEIVNGQQYVRTLKVEPGPQLYVMIAEIIADTLDHEDEERKTLAASLSLSKSEGAEA